MGVTGTGGRGGPDAESCAYGRKSCEAEQCGGAERGEGGGAGGRGGRDGADADPARDGRGARRGRRGARWTREIIVPGKLAPGKVVPRTSWMKTTPAVRKLTSRRETFHRSSINNFGTVSAPGAPAAGAARGAADGRSARSGREKRARTDDDDPVEGEPLLDDVSDAGREEAGLCRFVISSNACRFAACH